jgi:hypothetical protein
MPAIETSTCDVFTGSGCTNPPPSANFYPIFITGTDKNSGACVWDLGGPGIPGATNIFAGMSSAEYGSLLALNFPTTSGTLSAFQDYRNILGTNPRDARLANLVGPKNPIHVGTIKMGSSHSVKVRVANSNYAPIIISGLVPSADYSVVTDLYTGTLEPFAKWSATVKFAPTKVGIDTGRLRSMATRVMPR